MSKMSKRFVSCVLAVAMMTSLAPSTAFATDGSTESVSTTTENGEQSTNGNVAKIGEQKYATLQAAVEAAPKDGTETTIELISDTEVAEQITIEKGQNIIVNANHKTLTVSSDFSKRFFENKGTLTLTGNGTFDATDAGANGNGTVNNYGTLTVIDGTYINLKESNASNFYNRNGGTATFVNPTINGGGGCVATEANTTTTIQGGSYTNETYPAIENRGNMLITGGTFTNTSCSSCSGKWGYTIRSGESSDTAYLKIQGVDDNSVTVTGVQGGLAVIGGTADIYNGTYETIPCEKHPSGSSAFYAGYFTGESYKTSTNIYGGTFTSCTKTAIQIGNGNPAPDSGAGENSTVMIFGGTFTGGDTEKTAITVEQKDNAIGAAKIFGGTFSSNPTDYLKDGYKAENSNGTWTVGAESPVAQIGDKQYASLDDAVTAASVNDTIKVIDNTSLTKKLTINKNVTIDGNGKTITGDANDASVYIEVTGGTFNLSNATLNDFGGTAGTQSGNGVIKVPASAAEGTLVNTTNVNVSDFNRSAYDISAGTFSINGGTIDCTNSNDADTILTKGIKIGGTDSKVSGTISGVTIKNSASEYEEWNTAAIEIYSNADVDVTDCTISNVNKGIHVDNYWYATGDIIVDINGGNIDADSDAVMIYSKKDAANNVSVNILNGSFSGNVRILDKTDKDNIIITSGTFTVDPSDYVASGYTVQKNSDGTYEVVEKSSSGGGTVTPTPDPEEPSDSEETVTNPDGSTTTTITKEDGSSSTTTVGTDGKVESDVTVSEEAVSNADGAAVALPIPEVPVTSDRDTAPTVTVNLPSKEATKVEVPVKDATPGTVAVLVDADGNETVIKDTVQSENGITIELTDGATIKIVDNSKSFDDVADNYWGADAIDFATSRELFAGTGENEFSPEGDMTRAMIWSVLARYEGADTSGASGDEWYAGPQEWAIENGISDGTMANDSMTREQLAAMLYRYVGSPAVSGTVGDYSDADSISSWASDAMVWAVQEGLIAGMGENTLNPQGTATRTQVAAILQRFIENKMA